MPQLEQAITDPFLPIVKANKLLLFQLMLFELKLHTAFWFLENTSGKLYYLINNI